MSDNFLRLIPTDPRWQPDDASAGRGLAALRRVAPAAASCDEVFHAAVTFVDQGANFEELRCPRCGATLSLDWFSEEMDRPTFDDLSATTPCCQAQTSLNDLDFRWPAGFASFVLEAMNPNRIRLTATERERIEKALGHEVREIWAHY